MRENKFEKQVQKRLEDFQLNPSASVWENVENQIRKKKRRRVVFYILLPVALVLLGYLTNYYLFTGSKQELVQQHSSEKNGTSLTTNKTNIPSHKEESVIDKPQEVNKTGGFTKKETTQNQKINIVKNNRQLESKNPSTIEIKKRSAMKHNDGISLQNDHPLININAKQKSRTVTEKPVADEKIVQNITDEKKTQKDIDVAEDIVVAEIDPVITKTDSAQTENPADNKNESIAKKPVRRGGKTNKFKINWGLDLSVGLTSNHNSIFSLDKSYAADVLYNIPGNSTGGNPAVIIPPSSVRSGPSFKIGLAGEKQISKRSRFSTGLQYVYVSNRIKTGTKTDTAIQVQAGNNFSSRVDAVYRGAQQNNYTNSYHFIQIPFWYHWQINKSKKLPVQWNVGISMAYMVATNGLVYNSGYGGIYYRSKEAFTKTHFNLGSGFSFHLKTKNRIEWDIGPELSFDMNPLIKNDNKQYLLYGGLNTKLFFIKKKNK